MRHCSKKHWAHFAFVREKENKSLINPVVSAPLRDGLSIPASYHIIIVLRGCVSRCCSSLFRLLTIMARVSSTLALWLFAVFAVLVAAQNSTQSASLVSVLHSIEQQLPECAVRRTHHLVPRLRTASSLSITNTNSRTVRLLPGQGWIEVLCRGQRFHRHGFQGLHEGDLHNSPAQG